jgi:hypothetical protein
VWTHFLAAYGPETNWSNTSLSGESGSLLYLNHAAATVSPRFSYWVPNVSGTTAGVPPKLDIGDTLAVRCVTGATGKVIGATTNAPVVLDSTISGAGTVVWTGATAGSATGTSYTAGAGKTVLTRPPAFAAATTPLATTPFAGMAKDTFNAAGITTNLNCQGSWLEVKAMSASAYSTYALATTVGTINTAYSSGLQAVIRIRLYKANSAGASPAGFGTLATSNLSLCLKVTNGPVATSGHTVNEDLTKSAVCFFNSTIAEANNTADYLYSSFKSGNFATWQ